MGGIGSGRKPFFDAKDTTEDYRALDIRWLKREGILTPGADRRITWSRRGEVISSINVRAEADRLILAYRHRTKGPGSDWTDVSYPVSITTTG